MHIPACETRQLEILTFQQAMEHRDQSAEYDRSRWLYIPDFYSEYRYILGTVGKRPLITIGINPSTAAPDALDNTLKSVQRIALGNGFDSFIMFNVYAQRATNTDQMDKEFNEPLHRENMNAFRWVLERSGEHPALWAAWEEASDCRAVIRWGSCRRWSARPVSWAESLAAWAFRARRASTLAESSFNPFCRLARWALRAAESPSSSS